MICKRGGYIIQQQNEIWDLEAEILQAVCTDVEMEPVLQEVTGEVLPRGANKAPDVWLDIRAHGFWAENSLRSLMLGYATLTQTGIRISSRSRFISYTRMTKSAFTRLEFLRQNRAHAHLWFLLPLEACLMNVNVTTVSLSYWQSRNMRVTLPLSHGLGLESYLPSWGLHWFACEARVLGGELLQIYRRLI